MVLCTMVNSITRLLELIGPMEEELQKDDPA